MKFYKNHRPKRAVILDASLGDATMVVLLSLFVRLESWRYPIPTFSIFLAAFSSLSCSMPQFRQSTERIDKSIFPHLKPQSEQTWLVESRGDIIPPSTQPRWKHKNQDTHGP